jgi:hypothetical protein
MTIDTKEARARVQTYLTSDDFELEEFPEGWRVLRPIPEGMMGTPTLVIERDTGFLLRFASGIPPHRLAKRFHELREHAYVVENTDSHDERDG